MKPRIGYVGLSTPSFYDYRHAATAAASDQHDSPNPIIEGAFGALLLYDELWFFCESLCPENMRGLDCVKFINERGPLPDVHPKDLPNPREVFDEIAIAAFRESSSDYGSVKAKAHVYWDAAADNHTHSLRVGGLNVVGNSWDIRNVIFDILLTEQLGENVELITNSFTSRLFRMEASVRDKLVLSEVLVLDSVPQFLSPKGPYNPCIDEVRQSPYLTYFRKWIQTESKTASEKDVSEVKKEVEAKLAEFQRKVFMKHLDPRGSFRSWAETMLGMGMDLLIPGSATVKDLAGQWRDERGKQGLRWQGFLLDARQKVAKG